MIKMDTEVLVKLEGQGRIEILDIIKMLEENKIGYKVLGGESLGDDKKIGYTIQVFGKIKIDNGITITNGKVCSGPYFSSVNY